MKILNVLIDNYMGGPQERIISLGNELRKFEIQTIILAPNTKGDFARLAKEHNFKTYQIILNSPKYFTNIRSILSNIKWIITFPISVFLIIKIILDEQIDIVQANGLVNLQAPLAALLLRRRLVWYLSSTIYPQFLLFFLVPFVRLASDEIVIISERLRHYYFGNNGQDKNISLIVRCIDSTRFNLDNISEMEINILKRSLNINKLDIVVGCIGNVNPAKGYEYFLRSAKLIKLAIPNSKFIIVGDVSDSQREYFKKLNVLSLSQEMAGDVQFIGKREDIPQILSIFDIFVLSSVAEGGPAVVLEAMAMKRAIVATNVGAVSEYIDNGQNGIIVNCRDYQALADAVIYLSLNPDIRAIFGKKSRERLEKYFSFEAYVKQHLELYIKLFKK